MLMPILCVCVKFNPQNMKLAHYINYIVPLNLLIIKFLTGEKQEVVCSLRALVNHMCQKVESKSHEIMGLVILVKF